MPGNTTGFHLTPGQAHDLDGADVLLKDIQADAVIADKAYDAHARVIEPLHKAGGHRDSTAQRAARAMINATTTGICTKLDT